MGVLDLEESRRYKIIILRDTRMNIREQWSEISHLIFEVVSLNCDHKLSFTLSLSYVKLLEYRHKKVGVDL